MVKEEFLMEKAKFISPKLKLDLLKSPNVARIQILLTSLVSAFLGATPSFSQTTPVTYPSGLIGYWPFETSYNSEVGGWTGSPIDSPTAPSLEFPFINYTYDNNTNSGVDNGYVQTNLLPPTGSSARSISLWYRQASPGNLTGTGSADTLVGWGNSDQGTRYDFRFDNGNLRIEISGIGKTFQVPTESSGIGWHHALLTFPGGNFSNHRLYVDGVLAGTAADSSRTINTGTGTPLRIGTGILRGGNNARDYEGYMDELGIFNFSLDETDAALIHALGRIQLDLSNLDEARAVFNGGPGSQAEIGGELWNYASNLPGEMGSHGGSTIDGTIYIVLDTDGNGIGGRAWVDSEQLNILNIVSPTQNTDFAYAINSRSNSSSPSEVLKIETSSGEIVASIPVGSSASDLDLDFSENTLYVTDISENGIRTIALSDFSAGPVLLPDLEIGALEVWDENLILTADFPQNRLHLRNLHTGAIEKTSLVRGDDFKFNPVTNRIYTLADTTQFSLEVLNIEESPVSIRQAIPATTGQLLVSRNGQRVVGNQIIFDSVENRLNHFPDPILAISPDGNLVATTTGIYHSSNGGFVQDLSSPSRAHFLDNASLLVYQEEDSSFVKIAVQSPLTSPLPGSRLMESPAALTWEPVPDAQSYRVTLRGHTSLPVIYNGISNNRLEFETPLPFGYRYTWRVEAFVSSRFVLATTAYFQVSYPVAHESSFPQLSSFPKNLALSSQQCAIATSGSLAIFDIGVSKELQQIEEGSLPFVASSNTDRDLEYEGKELWIGNSRNIGTYTRNSEGDYVQRSYLFNPSPDSNDVFGEVLEVNEKFVFATKRISADYLGSRILVYPREGSRDSPPQFIQPNGGFLSYSFGLDLASEGNTLAVLSSDESENYQLFVFVKEELGDNWSQTQQIDLGNQGERPAIALSKSWLAVTKPDQEEVNIYSRENPGSFEFFTLVLEDDTEGSSPSFGESISFANDSLLIIEDSDATPLAGAGRLYSFNYLTASGWLQGADIYPHGKLDSFQGSFACHDNKLLIAGIDAVQIFDLSPRDAAPEVVEEIYPQAKANSSYESTFQVDDDGDLSDLRVDIRFLPDWLSLTPLAPGSFRLIGDVPNSAGNQVQIHLRIRDLSGSSTSYSPFISIIGEADAPSFLQPLPEVMTAGTGEGITLMGQVGGAQPLSFHWTRDGVVLPNENTSSLSFAYILPEDEGTYSLTARNAAGQVTSEMNLKVESNFALIGQWTTAKGNPQRGNFVPASLGNHRLTEAWTLAIDQAASGLVIANSRLYLSIENGGLLRSFHLNDGLPDWTRQFSMVGQPSYYEGRLYLSAVDPSDGISKLFALDATTGQTVWAHDEGQFATIRLDSPLVGFDRIWYNYRANSFNSTDFVASLDLAGTPANPGFGDFFSHEVLNSLSPSGLLMSSNFVADAVEYRTTQRHGGIAYGFAGDNALQLIREGNVFTALQLYDLDKREIHSADPSRFIASSPAEVLVASSQNLAFLDPATGGKTLSFDYSGDPRVDTFATQPILLSDHVFWASRGNTLVIRKTDGEIVSELPAQTPLAFGQGHLITSTNSSDTAFTIYRHEPSPGTIVTELGELLVEQEGQLFSQEITIDHSSAENFALSSLRLNGLPEGVYLHGIDLETTSPSVGGMTDLVLRYLSESLTQSIVPNSLSISLDTETVNTVVSSQNDNIAPKIMMLANKQPALFFEAQPGRRYVISTSLNGVNWTDLDSFLSLSNRVAWVDQRPTAEGADTGSFFCIRSIPSF